MSNNLTSKQELFSQEYMKDGNATRSYKVAYPRSLSWVETAVGCESSRLLNNPKISLRLQELKKEISDSNLWSRVESVKILKNIAENEDNKASEQIQAVKELNLMHGFNEPIKVDNLSSDASMSPLKLNIADFYNSIAS